MRVTHTLASGILLSQNFKDSVRFAPFQTGVDGWPYASHGGTVFLVSYRGRVLALTCAHVIGDFDWRGLSITDKKFGRRLALPTCLYYPSDLRGHAAGADIADLAVFGFGEDVDASRFSDSPYLLDDGTIGSSREGDALLVNGNLKDRSDLSGEAIRPEYALLELCDAGAAATDVTLRKAKAVFDNPALARITGCSGAPVFNATTERLCGMATRGSVSKGICTLWYLDIADIMAALTAVVEGRAEARYEKTVRRRVS